MPLVAVRFSPLPEHVRTARLVASAMGRRAGVRDEILDEVRFAVGEACARAVDLHQRFAPTADVVLELEEHADRFTVTVGDFGPSGAELVDPAAATIGSGVFDPANIARAGSPAPSPAAESAQVGGTTGTGDRPRAAEPSRAGSEPSSAQPSEAGPELPTAAPSGVGPEPPTAEPSRAGSEPSSAQPSGVGPEPPTAAPSGASPEPPTAAPSGVGREPSGAEPSRAGSEPSSAEPSRIGAADVGGTTSGATAMDPRIGPDIAASSGAHETPGPLAPRHPATPGLPRQPVARADVRGDRNIDFLPAGFGLAVIRGLVDDVSVQPDASGFGTRIRMSWPLPPPSPIG